jgi:uncharacterized protein YkwD
MWTRFGRFVGLALIVVACGRAEARPRQDPSPSPASTAARIVGAINVERARGRACGKRAQRTAPPLADVAPLDRLARRFASELLRTRTFSHTDAQGRDPKARAAAHGLAGTFLGETLARNAVTPEQGVAALFESEGHCRVLMDPDAQHAGVAFESSAGPRFESYLVVETSR